ncbi:MAG: serine/threonine protein kinase [Myxococcales bacterium]|nr:serine/threonine protein kinase [Myxococcales bacterium]
MNGRRLGGRYALDEPVGRGPNAVVYRATDTRAVGRVVATKVLHGRDRPDARTRHRFRREREILLALDHPNLLRLYDAGTDGETDWIVVDFAKTGSVGDLLRSDGPFDERSALDALVPALAALGAAHRAGVVHRAFGPDNILVGHRGQILLSDFTSATVLGQADEGDDRGRGPFAPPEQIASPWDVGPEADVYAAAATLVTLLTGRVPGPLWEISLGDPRWGSVPEWLRPLLSTAGALAPSDRFPSAEHLAAAIVEAAVRYGRPRSDELAALWEKVRPRTAPRPLHADRPPPEVTPEPTAPPPSVGHVYLSIAGGIVVAGALLALAAWVV